MSEVAFNHQLTGKQIDVSAEAIQQLIALTDEEPDVEGIRIFVSGGGCGGMTYGMTMVEQPTRYDCTWEKEGLKVFVDAVALTFMAGVEIDFKTDGMNQRFVFKNVFASTGGAGTCGACGSSGGGCG